MFVTDERIGVREKNASGAYTVTKRPTRYVNGAFYSGMANGSPTTTYFGPDKLYFYVLPIGMPAAPPQLREELVALVTPPEPKETGSRKGKRTEVVNEPIAEQTEETDGIIDESE
jgi:hypothetical protein